MTQISIQLKFTKLTDTYNRYGGLAIDEPLVSGWWANKPTQNIGMISSTQTISRSIELSDGSHTIEAGISAHSTTPWDIEIIVDNQSLITGSSYSGVNVSASFSLLSGKVINPTLKPLDRLIMIFQKLKSFFLPDESIEAY